MGDHLIKLGKVLSWLQSDGEAVNWPKCKFVKRSVECLGYIVGLRAQYEEAFVKSKTVLIQSEAAVPYDATK